MHVCVCICVQNSQGLQKAPSVRELQKAPQSTYGLYEGPAVHQPYKAPLWELCEPSPICRKKINMRICMHKAPFVYELRETARGVVHTYMHTFAHILIIYCHLVTFEGSRPSITEINIPKCSVSMVYVCSIFHYFIAVSD